MSACSMDTDSRKEFVKKLVAERKQNGTPDSVHGALGTKKVLKPINPGAYDFLDNKPNENKIDVKESREPEISINDELSQDDLREIRRFNL